MQNKTQTDTYFEKQLRILELQKQVLELQKEILELEREIKKEEPEYDFPPYSPLPFYYRHYELPEIT